MSEAKNIETVINEDLPDIFKHELGLDLLKVNVKSFYSENKKTVIIAGKTYCEDKEDFPLWNTIECDAGVLTCKSRSKGSFAIGVLKGKNVYIENIELVLNISNYPNIRRTLNLHKIKGGAENCFKEAVKGLT